MLNIFSANNHLNNGLTCFMFGVICISMKKYKIFKSVIHFILIIIVPVIGLAIAMIILDSFSTPPIDQSEQFHRGEMKGTFFIISIIPSIISSLTFLILSYATSKKCKYYQYNFSFQIISYFIIGVSFIFVFIVSGHMVSLLIFKSFLSEYELIISLLIPFISSLIIPLALIYFQIIYNQRKS